MKLYIKSGLEQLGLNKVAYHPGGEDAFGNVVANPNQKKPRKPRAKKQVAAPSNPAVVAPPIQNAPVQNQPQQNWGLEPAFPKQKNVPKTPVPQVPVSAPKREFDTNSEPYSLTPTNEEIQSARTPLDVLENNYKQVMQHVSILAQQVHQDQQAALQLLQEFRNIRPAWKYLREQVKTNPSFATTLNAQKIQQATQAFEQVLPMIAQMAMESKQDTVQISQFMNAAKTALSSIGQIANNAPAARAANSRLPVITAEMTSSSMIYRNNN